MGTSSRPSGPLVLCWKSISLTQVTYQGPNTFIALNAFQSNSMQEDESQYCVLSAPYVCCLPMANYEWAVASGKWQVGSGEWVVASGQWGVGSGEWAVGSGQWGWASGGYPEHKGNKAGYTTRHKSRRLGRGSNAQK